MQTVSDYDIRIKDFTQ